MRAHALMSCYAPRGRPTATVFWRWMCGGTAIGKPRARDPWAAPKRARANLHLARAGVWWESHWTTEARPRVCNWTTARACPLGGASRSNLRTHTALRTGGGAPPARRRRRPPARLSSLLLPRPVQFGAACCARRSLALSLTRPRPRARRSDSSCCCSRAARSLSRVRVPE